MSAEYDAVFRTLVNDCPKLRLEKYWNIWQKTILEFRKELNLLW